MITITESKLCVERRQFRFPRSRKRRIRNKWAKRRENFREHPTAFGNGPNHIICHPDIADRLRKEFQPVNRKS